MQSNSARHDIVLRRMYLAADSLRPMLTTSTAFLTHKSPSTTQSSMSCGPEERSVIGSGSSFRRSPDLVTVEWHSSSPLAHSTRPRPACNTYPRPRLKACTQLVLATNGRSADEIFPYPDNLRFWSCMTLFLTAATDNTIFNNALLTYFNGKPGPINSRHPGIAIVLEQIKGREQRHPPAGTGP